MKIDIASPCRGICKIDEPTQLCSGCLRSIEEITRWRIMDDDQKLAVLAACLERPPIVDGAGGSDEANEADNSLSSTAGRAAEDC